MHDLDLAYMCGPAVPADLLAAKAAHQFRRFCGWRGKFSALIAWRDINDILERSIALPPRVRLMKAGCVIDEVAYVRALGSGARRLDCDACLEQLRLGATLVIDAVDELVGPVGALARRMEQQFRAPTQVNLYAAWKSEPAFDLHWDPHDAIILQVAGRKRWRVYEETVKWPVDRESHRQLVPALDALVWEGELDDGDALFVPRGWWHEAIPCDGLTVHLTCGITCPTGLTVVEWLAQELKDDEFMRRDVPTDGTAAAQAAYLQELCARLEGMCRDPALLQRFLTARSAKCRKRERARLGPSIDPRTDVDPDTLIEITAPFATLSPAEGDGVSIGVGNKIITFGSEVAPILEYLLRHCPTPAAAVFEAFAPTYGHRAIETFTVELAEVGVVTLSTCAVGEVQCSSNPTLSCSGSPTMSS